MCRPQRQVPTQISVLWARGRSWSGPYRPLPWHSALTTPSLPPPLGQPVTDLQPLGSARFPTPAPPLLCSPPPSHALLRPSGCLRGPPSPSPETCCLGHPPGAPRALPRATVPEQPHLPSEGDGPSHLTRGAGPGGPLPPPGTSRETETSGPHPLPRPPRPFPQARVESTRKCTAAQVAVTGCPPAPSSSRPGQPRRALEIYTGSFRSPASRPRLLESGSSPQPSRTTSATSPARRRTAPTPSRSSVRQRSREPERGCARRSGRGLESGSRGGAGTPLAKARFRPGRVGVAAAEAGLPARRGSVAQLAGGCR